MNLFGRILIAIAPLFALIAIGYFAKRFRVLAETDAPVLNRIVVQITLPAFILNALLTHTFDAVYFKAPLVLWVGQGVVFGVVILLARLLHWQRTRTGAVILTGVFGNTGFLGYPMTTALLPALLPAAVLMDQVGMSLWLYPGALVLGAILAGQTKRHPLQAATGFLRSPIFLALAAGLVLRFMPHAWIPANAATIGLGRLVLSILSLVSSATIPIVLIAIGLTLRPRTVVHHGPQLALIAVLKLILLPIAAWVAGRYLFDLRGDLLRLCVLEAAMPPSAAATVFAGEFGMDASLAVAAFFALTLLSAATMPLMLALVR